MLDRLSNLYDELQLIFIDEFSLIGSWFLYAIENWLRNMKHMQNQYFGNIDMVFCGDFYQVKPMHNSLIFEHPTTNMQPLTYDFWEHNIKCYELQTTMH
jgi:hypothetical protein